MTKKTQAGLAPAKAFRRFAAVTAVLLTLCLVFMMPVGATEEVVEVSNFEDLKNNLTAGKSVKLVQDITDLKTSDGTNGWLITINENSVSSTLDLNGHHIHVVDDYSAANAGFIQVTSGCNLLITDSLGSGSITVTLGVAKSNQLSCVISPIGGIVTIESGTLKWINGESYSCLIGDVVDVNTNYVASKLIVKDTANLVSDGVGIRAFVNCNKNNILKLAEIDIQGGTITAKKSGIWIHQSSANTFPYKLTISDGSITSQNNAAIGYWTQNNGPTEGTAIMETIISGGTLTSGTTATSYPGLIGYSNSGLSISNHKLTITGGTFILSESATQRTIIGLKDSTKEGPTVDISGFKPTLDGPTSVSVDDDFKGIFSTNSGSSYKWFVDDVEVSGVTESSCEITFEPANTVTTKVVKANITLLEGKHYVEVTKEVTVPAKTYGITATEKVGFDSVKVGYTQPDKQKVTVENTGNVAVTLLEPTAENYIITGFTDRKLTIPYGGTVEFFIQPEAGLAVGNYGIDKVELKIEGSDAVMDTFAVSFLVYQPSSGGSSKPVEEPEEPEQPEEPVEPETPEEPSAGEVTTETAVSNGGEVAFETPAVPETPAAPEAGEPEAGTPSDAPAEPVVTGVVLPEGTDSKVTFIPVSEKPAPAGKEQQTKKVFEINVPTYEKGKPATVKFTMTVAELAKDGKTAADVALWHQDEETGEWTKLVISYTIIDGVVYFEAITHDFSPFAIVYEDTPVEEPTEEQTEEPASPAPIFAVLAGLGAAVILRRK